MKVLITGGAGFIGSHLAEEYLSAGHEVYIIDDLSTGTESNIKNIRANVGSASERLFVTIDTVLNRDVMLELVGICDVVIHFAAAVGVQYILDNPLSSIVTNIQGTEIVLELCSRFKKKVLVASTSEVYGKRGRGDHSQLGETDDCVYGPSTKSRWSYAAAKLMDEFTALAYHRSRGLPVIIVRFFNTVGPRQTGRYGMVVPRFISQALKGEPITVYGDGSQMRTFTHVREVVDCIIGLVDCEKAIGEVVNIGGVEEVTILELANRVKGMTDSRSTIEIIPYSEAYPKDFEDMQRRVPSTEKLNRLIGFVPKLDLDAILNDIVDAFQGEEEKDSTPEALSAVSY